MEIAILVFLQLANVMMQPLSCSDQHPRAEVAWRLSSLTAILVRIGKDDGMAVSHTDLLIAAGFRTSLSFPCPFAFTLVLACKL